MTTTAHAGFAAVLACLSLTPASAQTPEIVFLTAGDNTVLEMSRAFRRNDGAALAALLPQVGNHTLAPWAAYWELKNRLETASPDEVQNFFVRYAGTYQEDRLRNDWLLWLGKRRDWANFAAQYPRFRMNDDREVRCYALLEANLRSSSNSTPAVVDEVRQNWYAQRDADDGCKSAAEQLLQTRQLSALDVWRKARLAMESNRATAVRDAVEMVAPGSMPVLASIQASPSKFLLDKSLAFTRVRKELITLALVKLAVSDAPNAAVLLESKWGVQLNAEERNWVWGLIGKQTASRLGPDALSHFGKVSRLEDLTDDMLAWNARAALRAGSEPRWPLVLAAVKAMSATAQNEPTWTYWKARALLATDVPTATTVASTSITPQRAQAIALLRSIASPRGFYEQLALEELGEKIDLPPAPAPLTTEELARARQNPSLIRGIYAITIGLRGDGVREWNYGTNLHTPGGMGERDLLAAAQMACDRAIWDRCINTSERTKDAFDSAQRFPTPFREAVLKRSREIGLDPAYVYGLIRQESRFIMDARSHVGASGLMQVMPATARETARYIGMTGFTPNQINDRDTNIVIGTAYLKRALDDFGGSMALAAAAYNAGPGRPRNWRNGPLMEAAIWAENVPFGETRDYVKKVLSNTTAYAALLTGQPQSIKSRLGMVGPRAASAPPPDTSMP